jgi:Uma2 family endonuclease
MASLVSVDEYRATTYRPDREFVEGRLIERNLGEYDHSNLQGAVLTYFRSRRREWKARVLMAQRLQVASNRFRVPGVSVFSRTQPVEQVFTKPPLVCIEVLSKDDTLRSMQDRIDDYRAFGVPNIWVLDPTRRRAYICTHGDFREPEDGVLAIEHSPIRISLNDLFADLD